MPGQGMPGGCVAGESLMSWLKTDSFCITSPLRDSPERGRVGHSSGSTPAVHCPWREYYPEGRLSIDSWTGANSLADGTGAWKEQN